MAPLGRSTWRERDGRFWLKGDDFTSATQTTWPDNSAQSLNVQRNFAIARDMDFPDANGHKVVRIGLSSPNQGFTVTNDGQDTVGAVFAAYVNQEGVWTTKWGYEQQQTLVQLRDSSDAANTNVAAPWYSSPRRSRSTPAARWRRPS